MQLLLMASENGRQLRAIRMRMNLTQEEFATRLGVTRARYKNWEYGLAEAPDEIVLKAVGLDSYREVTIKGIPLAPIPVVGAASAGEGSQFHPDLDQLWVPQYMARLDSRGWEAEGDSMLPWIQPGDIVVARDYKSPKLGYPFMIRREDGSTSVKILAYDQDWVYKSLNPKYDPEPARGELLGYVIGIYRSEGTFETTLYDPNGLRPKNFF